MQRQNLPARRKWATTEERLLPCLFFTVSHMVSKWEAKERGFMRSHSDGSKMLSLAQQTSFFASHLLTRNVENLVKKKHFPFENSKK